MSSPLLVGTYIELNDKDESVICCSDIVSVGLNNTIGSNCIVIDYKMINAVTIEYEYDSIDLAMKDLKKIKEAIKSFANVYIEK